LLCYVCVTISWYLFVRAIENREPFSNVRETSKRAFRSLEISAICICAFDVIVCIALFFSRKYFWLVFFHVYFTFIYCCCLVIESLVAIVVAVLVVKTLLTMSNYNLSKNNYLTAQVIQVLATAVLIAIIFFFCLFVVFSAFAGNHVETITSSQNGIIVVWEDNLIVYFMFYTFGQFIPVSIMVALQSKLPQMSSAQLGDEGTDTLVDSTHPPTLFHTISSSSINIEEAIN